MNHPELPPTLLTRLEPVRVELRAVITAIHAEPNRLDLWCEADALNNRLAEIERDYFEGKEAA